MVEAYRLKSEHSFAYLGISGHWGITWWLAHTISTVLDPRHVHQAPGPTLLCDLNTVSVCIERVSNVYYTVFVEYKQIHTDTQQIRVVFDLAGVQQ